MREIKVICPLTAGIVTVLVEQIEINVTSASNPSYIDGKMHCTLRPDKVCDECPARKKLA